MTVTPHEWSQWSVGTMVYPGVSREGQSRRGESRTSGKMPAGPQGLEKVRLCWGAGDRKVAGDVMEWEELWIRI